MATTLSVLQGAEGADLFYWLRITGLPYYFFCGLDPTATGHPGGWGDLGADSGMTSVLGMDLPDDQLSQAIPDLIGGVASAERITLNLIDFEVTDTNGTYPFLARLFSPGVAIAAGRVFELASDIGTTDAGGDPVSIRSGTVTPGDGFYCIGGETIALEAFGAPVDGVSTGSILGTRNRYPCAASWPAVPYHRVSRNADGTPGAGRNILVTPSDAPLTMLGRTAAFYVGHLTPAGVPCAESEGLLRVLGRIKTVARGKDGRWGIEIEGMIGDLSGALVAPGLATAKVKDDQIILPTGLTPTWTAQMNTFRITYSNSTWSGTLHKEFTVTIDNVTGVDDNNFDLVTLRGRINDALAGTAISNQVNDITYGIRLVDNEVRSAFFVENIAGHEITITGVNGGILSALGYESDKSIIELKMERRQLDSPYLSTNEFETVATRALPSIFIPVTAQAYSTAIKFAVEGLDGSQFQHFFTDQGDGSAYVQFGDGLISKLGAVTNDAGGGISLTIEGHIVSQDAYSERFHTFYYVPRATKGTVKQIVLAGNLPTRAGTVAEDTDPGLFVGRLLASFDVGSALDDFNYYPEGVGLGWNTRIDKDSFRAIALSGKNFPRGAIVDNTTKLADLMTAILKEFGIALVWNPETALITARQLRIPSAPGAHALSLSESNRASSGSHQSMSDDVTTSRIDPANVRSSWTLVWGWDSIEKKFVAPEVTIVDNAVRSAGFGDKAEKLEDKTLVVGSDLDGLEFLGALIYARSHLYSQPWERCSRSLNRFGLTVAPGSYHKIVDGVVDPITGRLDSGMVNPFTGRLGIASADALYGMLISVEANPYTHLNRCEFLIDRQGQSSFYRKWSPTGLVDVTAAGRGYNTATGVLTMARRYSSHATNKDGWDFIVGDTVAVMSWDNGETGPTYSQTSTITAVATDGSTVTIASGLTAIPVGVETLLMLQDYDSSTATRTGSVAYQGSQSTGIIEAVAGAKNHRWG